MNVSAHPDPERLAALAGDDADARADRGLTQHVAECAACTGLVRDVTALRLSLANLPDMPPSRPLTFLPPVPDATPSPSWRLGLRRLFAPMAVAGLVLLLVGSVGASGALEMVEDSVFLRFGSDAAAAPEMGEEPGSVNTDNEPSPPGDGVGIVGPTSAPPDESGGRGSDLDTPQPGSGWIAVMVAGFGLLGGALVLRARTRERVNSGRG